jgi:hypothetical protein
MCDSWLSSINNFEIVGAVFLDFKKAFDLVNHDILLKKAKLYLQNESTTRLMKSFLDTRTQMVYVNGCYSCLGQVECGVPQGSVLGPLLFCIFINDLPLCFRDTNVVCDMFADDNTLHTSSSETCQIQDTLQTSIDDVNIWCSINKMILNPDKTKCMTITSRQKHQKAHLSLTLYVHSNTVKQVNSHRVLGVIIDDQFSWEAHINNVCKIVSRNLFLMGKLKHIVGTAALKMYFYSHCLSHMNYASTIFSGACDVHIKKLNSLHRRGAKMVVSSQYLTSDEKLKVANILPLQQQFHYNIAILMYKVTHGIAPLYLLNLLNKSERSISHNFLLPRTRIDLYKLSFSFTGPYVWNSLPSNLKVCTNFSTFKRCLRQHLAA